MVQCIFFVLRKRAINLNIPSIYDCIVKSGLTTFKVKHSHASLPALVQAQKLDKQSKKGAIFAVRDKSHFLETKVKGYIVTSKETLLEDAANLTHFTPNVYRTFGYQDEERRFIYGFEEQNLLQINTFVIDIDTAAYSREDILMACMDESIGLPTLIVRSDRGYQVFFVLEKPLFISNNNSFRGLKVAKRISDNLKRSLQSVEADRFCNDFGFFRMPTEQNIVYCDLNNTYSTKQFINWSMKCDSDIERPLFVVPTKGTQKASVMESDWLQALIQAVDVKGQKGQIGRNNTLFTLALVCLQEGWSEDRTFDFLDEFNSKLLNPLKARNVQTIIQSAFSGKYHGPAKEYVEALLDLYVPGQCFEVKLGGKGWYKFKKAREDRERSHFDEWEQDIEKFLTSVFNVSEPFVWRTQKEICDAVGISSSTLNALMKRSTRLIKIVSGKGRTSKTGWTTVTLMMKHVLFSIQLKKSLYKQYIQQIQIEVLPLCQDNAAIKLFELKLAQYLAQTAPVVDDIRLDGSG
jgi:hypothetical protein